MEGWRLYITIAILILSSLDLILTLYYISVYKGWQPDKPYKLIELNPLLVFLWNNYGLYFGMFIGSVVILALNYFVSRHAHWIIVLIVLGIMIFAIINHFNNITLLSKLMEQYPTGYLPRDVFRYVEGNNLFGKPSG